MKLVGREVELASLRESCLRARDGRGQVIVVSGEPGLGKTALVDTIATELADTFAVTWGRAWELAHAPAYFPLWPCLKSLGIALDPARSEFELWEHVLDALVRASAQRPVLWAIDDLHVADTQTLDLLCFIAQAIRALPIVMIATTRAQDPRLDDSAQQRIVRLIRNGREIRLQPLASGQVAALAAQWIGRDLATTELAQLVERTGGNPLFVVECARAKLDTVPQTVAVVVGERVALLPEVARALVADAAVLGNEFTAAALAAMSDRLPARAIDDLAPVLRAGIVEELSPGRYKFSHALVRDAIEAAMPAQQRTAAHARALATLDDTHAIDRARHALASQAPDVLAIVERAIALLEREGTYDRAAALCKQLDALRSAGTLPPATSTELVRAARIALAAGKFADSRELCLRALAVARDATEYAQAALALGAEVHPANIDDALVEHLQHAQDRLGIAASPLRCRVSARLAAALQPAPHPLLPIEMARAAIADARAMNDPVLLADVLYVAISALTDFVDSEELRTLNREHLDLALAGSDVARTLRAYVRLIYAEGELGDFTAQDQHIDQMLRLANRVGHPRLTWRALLMGSMRAIARGQFSESERYITEVERAMQVTDDPSLAMALQAHRHHRALDLHRETTVANGLAQMEPVLAALPAGHMIIGLERGLCAARFGDATGAELALAGLAIDPILVRDSVAAHGILGEICAAGGTREQRQVLLARLAPVSDRHIYFGHTPMAYCGPIRRVLGLLEISLGHRAAGEQHLRRALDTCRSLGFATWVARIAYELGDTDEAARLANNLGIRGLAKRAQASVTDSAPATRPSLGMVREGEVWRISYGVRVARIADSRGMELIAKLVERPGEEMHVLVLAGTGGETLTESHAGDALDDRAARSYRERLAELRDDLAQAEAHADRGRIELLSAERDFLEAELSRAFGLGGAARKSGSMSERARVNVQRRIKDSLTRIGQHDSVIADYLRSAIRTGTYCTFRP